MPGGHSRDQVGMRQLWQKVADDVQDVKSELRKLEEELAQGLGLVTNIIRGGDGEAGLVTSMKLAESAIAGIRKEIDDLKDHGTHPSQLDIRLLKDKNEVQDAELRELSRKLKDREKAQEALQKQSDDRRWQITALAVTTAVSLVGMVVSVVLHFVSK